MAYQAAIHEDGTHMVCAWYALCDHPAEYLSRGPVGDGQFDLLPVCSRCARTTGIPAEALHGYEIEVDGGDLLISVNAPT